MKTEKQWTTKDWTQGELNALVKNLGEDLARQIQEGKVKVKEVEDIIMPLFNRHGHRIFHDPRFPATLTDTTIKIDQPIMFSSAYNKHLANLHESLGIDTGITAKQFESEAKKLYLMTKKNPQLAKITNGPWLPIVMPRNNDLDYGTVVQKYMDGVRKSYLKAFPTREFMREVTGLSKDRIYVTADMDSRYHQLKSITVHGSVVGILFPYALPAHSVLGSREQMKELPEGFFLSGLDILVGMIMYPKIMMWTGFNPNMYLSALSCHNGKASFIFKVYHDGILFDTTTFPLNSAFGNCSSGLLYIGEYK